MITPSRRTEVGFGSTDAGDALNAMFFQPPRFASHGRPSIPDNWSGLAATMPTLTSLVAGGPSSGYLASIFLNLVESSPRAELLPFVVQARQHGAGPTAPIPISGQRRTLAAGCVLGSTGPSQPIQQWPMLFLRSPKTLLKCLDIFIQSGVAQAHEIEERIANIGPNQKTA